MNRFSDITLADPWLKEYISIEKTGKSLVVENASGGYFSSPTMSCRWLYNTRKNSVFKNIRITNRYNQ